MPRQPKTADRFDTIPPELCTRAEAAAILGYKHPISSYTAKVKGFHYTYAIVNDRAMVLFNREEVELFAKPKPPTDGYISYRELHRIIQEGRIKCGLPPYKWHGSLHSRLRHYRIPTFRVSENEVLYHKETALKLLLPQLAIIEATAEDTADLWVNVSTILEHANKLRASLRLAPLKNTSSVTNVLHARNVPFIPIPNHGRNKLYNLEAALRALTQFEPPKHQKPIHRSLTPEELKSGDYMPVTEAAQLLNCHPGRISAAAEKLGIRVRRHPHTNRQWVYFQDAMRVAYFRSQRFIFKTLPLEQAHQIIATRPKITFFHEAWGFRKYSYFVPELSHIGSKNTAAHKKRRGTYPEPLKQDAHNEN